MTVSFIKRQQLAENIATFWFKPTKKIKYMAGQFIEITIPHENPDDRGTKRWFTLSSSPSNELISITTKFSALKGSTFKHALNNLMIDDKLHISQPMGDFVLPKDVALPLVFVAGGIGITPMHSMISWLNEINEKRSIHLIYAASSNSELVFMDLFNGYCNKVNYLTPENGDNNRLSAKRILELTINENTEPNFYISGPEAMTESIVKQFSETNISNNQLVTDYFPGYTDL